MITMVRYEMLDQHLLLDRECLVSFQNLKNFHARSDIIYHQNCQWPTRFEKLEAVAAYKKSAKPLPCNNTSAAWGSKWASLFLFFKFFLVFSFFLLCVLVTFQMCFVLSKFESKLSHAGSLRQSSNLYPSKQLNHPMELDLLKLSLKYLTMKIFSGEDETKETWVWQMSIPGATDSVVVTNSFHDVLSYYWQQHENLMMRPL